MNKLLVLLLLGFSFSLFGQDAEAPEGTMMAWYQCLDEDVESIEIKKQKNLYFEFNVSATPDSSRKEKFTWLTDYPESYFTAYLINSADTVVNIERQDGSLMMIQEAVNRKGEWEPIEHWVFSWCGNSYFNPLALGSGQQVLVPIKIYSGNYKTKVRLKLKIGKSYFYSDSFEAKISYSQFRSFDKVGTDEIYINNLNYFEELDK